MSIIPFSARLEELLTAYHKAGGNLAYVQFEVPADATVDYRALNLAAAPEVIKQYWGGVDIIAKSNPDMAAQMTDWKPELMKSRVISLEQFLGPYYDMPSKRLIVHGQTNDHLNDHFYYDDAEMAANVIPWDRVDPIDRKPFYDGHIQGYANAFWGGPYRMRGLTMRQIGELFNDINHELFNDFVYDSGAEPEIRLWSNDWWPFYFAAGLEWDGAYWWTLHDKARQRVVVVSISVTD